MNFKYEETKEIAEKLSELELLQAIFEKLPILTNIEENIRRNSLLKSAVFSAKIEGLAENIYDERKIEVQNLLKAYKEVYRETSSKKLSLGYIYNLHEKVMHNLSLHAGKLRQEPWAIFNQAGMVVHLAPGHANLPKLMDEYTTVVSSLKFSPVVNAAIAHFLFEKIHPFADGNGRVGRLISAYLLNVNGYGFKGMVPLEEYIDENRSDYYSALEPINNVGEFVQFFVTGLVTQANIILAKTQNIQEEKPEDMLLPRRREILEIIKDHPSCSFDYIKRRFMAVNEKTLHYDLSCLQKASFITKVGKTRGALYKPK